MDKKRQKKYSTQRERFSKIIFFFCSPYGFSNSGSHVASALFFFVFVKLEESVIFMSRCQNLKNLIKSERSNIFEIGHTRKKLKKTRFFYYPLLLQCMEIIWVNFFKNQGMGMKFNIKNTLSMAANIISSIHQVKFHSYTLILGKDYPDYYHALEKQRVVKK